jgi:CubicO group peptidase (beta-lactamase class C family)
MKKYYFTLFLSFLITVGFSQEVKKDYTEAFKLVEVWLEAQKDFDNLPGLTAIVIEDQKVLWSGAVGLANIEKNIKAEASTLCSICSISKLFTSIAIMKLYDEGKLRLDDRVSDILPAYNLQQKYPESGPITIRSLLTHSSGLPREADFPYWTGPDFPFPTKVQIDSKLSEQETLYPASTYFQYSNLGLTLLGEIVEEISGMSYDEYVKQNILEPLGLSDTRTDLPEQLYGTELAIGYSAMTRSRNREKVNFFQANGITPAAGFSSNVQDLGKFASWQLRLRDTTVTEILKPSTIKYMQNVHWTDPDWKTTRDLVLLFIKGKTVPHGSVTAEVVRAMRLHFKLT